MEVFFQSLLKRNQLPQVSVEKKTFLAFFKFPNELLLKSFHREREREVLAWNLERADWNIFPLNQLPFCIITKKVSPGRWTSEGARTNAEAINLFAWRNSSSTSAPLSPLHLPLPLPSTLLPRSWAGLAYVQYGKCGSRRASRVFKQYVS